jgi:hypothetical protein
MVPAGELESATGTLVNSFNAVSFAAASTSATGMLAILPLTLLASKPVESAKSRLDQTLERFPLLGDARSSMQRLRLDVRAGKYRTPLELLEDAAGALERPVSQEGGPTSILIPLRECIQSVIAELLRRRPNQEPAAKIADKLASLARQCALPSVAKSQFDNLAHDAEILVNELSGTKQAEMSRAQITAVFHRGLLFLNALMAGIDQNALRPA